MGANQSAVNCNQRSFMQHLLQVGVFATLGETILTAVADKSLHVIDRISAEDETRAQVYRLLATLLSRAPDAALLKSVASLTGGPGRFGEAIGTLAKVAAATPEHTVRSEYQDLFIGLGRGELVPYGSYYLTGFLQEKPLAALRRDMARLGIDRASETSDPEDHAASVLEAMAGLIDGRFGKPASLDVQKEFQQRHLASWLPVFFRDLGGGAIVRLLRCSRHRRPRLPRYRGRRIRDGLTQRTAVLTGTVNQGSGRRPRLGRACT